MPSLDIIHIYDVNLLQEDGENLMKKKKTESTTTIQFSNTL